VPSHKTKRTNEAAPAITGLDSTGFDSQMLIPTDQFGTYEVKDIPPIDGWILEYDTPRGNNAKRIAFYRAVRRLQWEYIRKEAFSSRNCYFTDNGEFAQRFYELLRRFDKKCKAYAVVRVK